MTRSMLNTMLIKHYDCFNRERFWLDEFEVYPDGSVFINIASSIYDAHPVKLCRNIAKYIKKNFVDKYGLTAKYIYVGAWTIKV